MMPTRPLAPIVLLTAIVLIVAMGACLVHPDEGATDLCSSLLAVPLGLVLVLGLDATPELAFPRQAGYRARSFAPPAPPPKI
jgi:hypothetical protein